MALKITGIGAEITAIIRKQSEAILEKQMPRIKREMLVASEVWRNFVRKRMGAMVPKPWDSNTPRNLTPWPKRRTGKLYFSILRPDVSFSYRTKAFKAKRGKASIEFVVKDFYGSVADTGYGDKLNTMVDSDPQTGTARGVKPFAGWKTRASAYLFDVITSRAKL